MREGSQERPKSNSTNTYPSDTKQLDLPVGEQERWAAVVLLLVLLKAGSDCVGGHFVWIWVSRGEERTKVNCSKLLGDLCLYWL